MISDLLIVGETPDGDITVNGFGIKTRLRHEEAFLLADKIYRALGFIQVAHKDGKTLGQIAYESWVPGKLAWKLLPIVRQRAWETSALEIAIARIEELYSNYKGHVFSESASDVNESEEKTMPPRVNVLLKEIQAVQFDASKKYLIFAKIDKGYAPSEESITSIKELFREQIVNLGGTPENVSLVVLSGVSINSVQAVEPDPVLLFAQRVKSTMDLFGCDYEQAISVVDAGYIATS